MQIDDLTLHWLAGLLEGEGSFVPGTPSQPNHPRIHIKMTDEDVIAKVADIFGTRYAKSGTKRSIEHGWKQAYTAKISSRPAVKWMGLLRPLMGKRRQGQIDRAVASYEDKWFRALTDQQIEELRVRALNGESPFHLAKEYGISKTLAYYIKDGYNYKYSRGCSSVVEHLPSKQIARVRFPPPANILLIEKPTDFYWLAGLLEAEGSFQAPSPSSPNTPKISISMSDEDVIARVADLFQLKYSMWQRKKENTKPAYIVQLRGHRAVGLMHELHPLMGERRKGQIDRAIANFDFNPNRVGRTVGKPKLDVEQVREIKKQIARGERHAYIADRYGVSRSTISSINRGETWTEVTIDDE
jgi:hypothetical protein